MVCSGPGAQAHREAHSSDSTGSRQLRLPSLLPRVQEVAVVESGDAADLRTMKNKNTGELVSAKWVQRESGAALGRQTEREIINHRKLLHPNILRLLEVWLCCCSCQEARDPACCPRHKTAGSRTCCNETAS